MVVGGKKTFWEDAYDHVKRWKYFCAHPSWFPDTKHLVWKVIFQSYVSKWPVKNSEADKDYMTILGSQGIHRDP